MKTWTTQNCTIYQVLEGRSNSFLVNSGNNYILIDTGRKNSWRRLKSRIDKILGEAELSGLILTHTHFDHTENAAKIKKKYNSQIIIHQSEAEYLRHGNSPLPKGTNLTTGFMINTIGKRVQSRYNYETADPDIIVDKKYDLIDFGFNAQIIHTPGHSKGSMSIIIDHEIAIVGDAMFGVFGNSIYPPFADDTAALVKSWNRLIHSNCNLFLPGHGKEIRRKLLEMQYEKQK